MIQTTKRVHTRNNTRRRRQWRSSPRTGCARSASRSSSVSLAVLDTESVTRLERDWRRGLSRVAHDARFTVEQASMLDERKIKRLHHSFIFADHLHLPPFVVPVDLMELSNFVAVFILRSFVCRINSVGRVTGS